MNLPIQKLWPLALVVLFSGNSLCWPAGESICNSPEIGTLVTGDSSAPYNTIVLPQFANPRDGFYTGYKITITSGTGRYSAVCTTGQTNCAVESIILNYVGATRTATVAFSGPTANGDGYSLARGCYDEQYAGVGNRVTGGTGTGAGSKNVTQRWRMLVNNGEIVGRPATTEEGGVVVGTSQGTVAKFTAAGQQLWSIYCGSVMSGPTVGPDGTIYVASGSRSVWALTGDGAVKWTSAMATPLVAPVTYQELAFNYDDVEVPEGLLVGDLQGNLTKLNVDGSVAWVFHTGGELRAGASVLRDGKVVFGSLDGYLYCLYGNNGSLAWRYFAGQEIASRPLVQDVSVVFGTRQNQDRPGRLVALTMAGLFRWEYNLTSTVESEPIEIPSTSVVYASSNDGKIWAIRPDGTLLWRYVTGGAGGVCGNLDKLPDPQAAPSTAAQCTPAELRVQGATSPTLCGDSIVTTSQNKYVYGLGPRDGELRWKFATARRIRSPARCWEQTDAFGRRSATVFTGSNDRYLYALDLPAPRSA